MTAAADPEFESLLEQVRATRGSDFTSYKRSTLARRFRKRMDEVGVEGYPEYAAYLDAHPDEFTALFNTILINVTSFFRDPEAWEALTREVLEPLAVRRPEGPIRVWSAGCASGEEVYSVVMALAEVLGADAFRERVKVYATDVDEEALAAARQAVYPEKALEAVPEALRERYFEPLRGRFAFRADLRRLVIFGRNDLVRDAPISHLDLLISRNTLMYFNADVQARILSRFHFALGEHGVLFLGKAEMLRTHGALFTPLNLRARLFSRVRRPPPLRERMLGAAGGAAAGGGAREQQLRLREAVLEAEPWAQVVVSPEGTLVVANARAKELFALSPVDVGRPLRDLTLSYRPVDLRTPIEQVLTDGAPLRLERVEHRPAEGEPRTFEVHLTPLHQGHTLLGVAVAYLDMTAAVRLQAQLEEAGQELETAFEELQSTNEELETTNEELQSTNEELETMNEELQSTNEELQTVNTELRDRTEESNHLNGFLESVLSSLRSGAIVVNQNFDVLMWNPRSEDLWGLRRDEVRGRSLFSLDIGLPLGELRTPMRSIATGETETQEV
ncbi:MAG: CheR family methyltransferase, partial [Longimicrobiaceae bacterium]